ncbi:MAG: thiamine phosphate synthase [Candidatus Dormibacteria bacterium]
MSQAWVEPTRSSAGLERRARLHAARLYLVTDDETPAAELPQLISLAVSGGVDLVQLRRKHADPGSLESLASDCQRAAHLGGALFLVDDHVELALAVDADGVHLGQSDLDPVEARRLVGSELLVGLSTHSKDQVLKAASQSVDYLSAGPVHATPTKPGRPAVGLEYVQVAASRALVPVVAIGGLGLGGVGPAIAAGADMVGVVRAICQAKEPERIAATLREEVLAAPRWLRLQVNGEPRRCPPGNSIGEFLQLLELRIDGVVVERNGDILRMAELGAVLLRDGDRLEIVHLVGGGTDHG